MTTTSSGGIALANEIEQAIDASTLEAGSLFATEDELRPRHGSGRSTIRQAARILEQRGVAFMRRGVGGGLIVMEPDPEAIGRMLGMVIGSKIGTFFDMLRLIKATDASVIPGGIGLVDLARCDRLRALADAADLMAADEFMQSRAHWHLLREMLGALGNPATLLSYHCWMEVNADLIPHAMAVSETRRRGEYWALSVQCVEALVAGDIGALFELRGRQIRFAVDWHAWRKMETHRSLSPSLNSPNLVDFSAGRHGAARLSRELLHEIRLHGSEPDRKLGDYAELMERYGASAAVLRQAIRMLEECSLAYTRRGRSGGLFIGWPDAAIPVARAVTHLRQAGVSAEALRALLTQILLECLSQLPDRASAETMEALQAEIANAARDRPGTVPASLTRAIARATGNAALDIWVEILIRTLPAQAGRRPPSDDQPACYDALSQSIATYDSGRSRRALLHLARSAELIGTG